MPRNRNLLEKYNIGKHRFYELYHFCLQYNDWKWSLDNIYGNGVKSPQISDMPKGKGLTADVVSDLGIKRAEIEHNIMIIEDAARAADESLYEYILYAVTNEDITYKYLSTVKRIPCSKNTWYAVRKKFYYMLDGKKGK